MKIEGHIYSFTDEYECFNINYPANFTYFGGKWKSIEEAYNSLVEDDFNTHRKLNLMGNIIYQCYKQNNDMAAVLLKTQKMWIQNSVKNHDNFWHNCTCFDCFTEDGNNYYGRLLMEVRDRILWESKLNKHAASKRWNAKYFDK
jgi:predicted NAD-dependent protein-ADP-ribosyltransferase YbiA (DUF1768 family)